MNGKWFLISARPERVPFVLEACLTQGSQPLDVLLDEGRLGIGPLMDAAFEAHPDLDFYGWLADDTYPQTEDWDVTLSRAAGRDGLAYAADGGYQSVESLEEGSALSSGLCWGGDLLRAAGSWSLGFHSAWIDVAWCDLIRPLSRHRYLPDVLVRHDHWRTGRRERDELDEATAARIEQDRERFHEWQETERRLLLQRLEAICVS